MYANFVFVHIGYNYIQSEVWKFLDT